MGIVPASMHFPIYFALVLPLHHFLHMERVNDLNKVIHKQLNQISKLKRSLLTSNAKMGENSTLSTKHSPNVGKRR